MYYLYLHCEYNKDEDNSLNTQSDEKNKVKQPTVLQQLIVKILNFSME